MLLRRVVNASTTWIGGPASGGLAPANLGLTMAAVGSQATVQGSFGAVATIIYLTKNMGGPATNTQVVQLTSTPPTQPERPTPTTNNFLGN